MVRVHTHILLVLVLGPGAAACLDASLLDGKLCDQQGACLPGYACDPATNRCVRKQDPPDGGEDGADSDGDGQAAGQVSNLGPEGLTWLCASDQELRLTGDGSLDTDTGLFQTPRGPVQAAWFRTIPQPGEGLPALSVIALRGLHIQPNATLRITGQAALVILTCQEVDIKGSLDGSGQAGQMQPDAAGVPGQGGPGGFTGGAQNGQPGLGPGGGAGGGEADCHELADAGGSGGGFGARGGAGGDGRSGEDCVRSGPQGGRGYGSANAIPLQGGSGGGGGGDGSGGPGGGGGGAVQLVSAGRISIAAGARIRAAGGGGAGGHDGRDSSAGGGGGAGGSILLEAPTVTIGGALVANGGGGGAGYEDNLEWADQVAPDGFDGGFDASPAPGGAGEGLGGGGGEGGAGQRAEGRPGQAAQNGGGGGGAAGRIRINSATGQATFEAGAVISPSDVPGGCSGGCTQGPLP